MREHISEEELAVFDILTRPGPELDAKETEAIKKVCKDLLAKLKTELLVLAWRNKQQPGNDSLRSACLWTQKNARSQRPLWPKRWESASMVPHWRRGRPNRAFGERYSGAEREMRTIGLRTLQSSFTNRHDPLPGQIYSACRWAFREITSLRVILWVVSAALSQSVPARFTP